MKFNFHRTFESTQEAERFLAVDYMRRLAMDSAASRGFRLVLQPVKIERTGREELPSPLYRLGFRVWG